MANWISETFQVLANISTALGIPLAISLFYQDRKKEIREREYIAYDSLDSNYIEYLKLCLDNPDLDVFDLPIEEGKERLSEQERRETIMFGILFSVLERAFLMYEDESTGIKIRRRIEWERYIVNDWIPREKFRKMWKIQGEGYYINFVRYMNSLIRQYENGRQK
jgi:transcriptional regulator with XRE-family HTH domain